MGTIPSQTYFDISFTGTTPTPTPSPSTEPSSSPDNPNDPSNDYSNTLITLAALLLVIPCIMFLIASNFGNIKAGLVQMCYGSDAKPLMSYSDSDLFALDLSPTGDRELISIIPRAPLNADLKKYFIKDISDLKIQVQSLLLSLLFFYNPLSSRTTSLHLL